MDPFGDDDDDWADFAGPTTTQETPVASVQPVNQYSVESAGNDDWNDFESIPVSSTGTDINNVDTKDPFTANIIEVAPEPIIDSSVAEDPFDDFVSSSVASPLPIEAHPSTSNSAVEASPEPNVDNIVAEDPFDDFVSTPVPVVQHANLDDKTTTDTPSISSPLDTHESDHNHSPDVADDPFGELVSSPEATVESPQPEVVDVTDDVLVSSEPSIVNVAEVETADAGPVEELTIPVEPLQLTEESVSDEVVSQTAVTEDEDPFDGLTHTEPVVIDVDSVPSEVRIEETPVESTTEDVSHEGHDGNDKSQDPFDAIVDDVVDEPSIDPVVEPSVEEIVESSEPSVQPVMETIVEVTEPVTEPVVEPSIEPIVDPIVESIAEPVIVTEPVEELVVSATEPLVEPITETVEESVINSIAPIEEPTVQVIEPIVEPAVEQIVEPVVESSVDPAAELTTGPAVESSVDVVEPIFEPVVEVTAVDNEPSNNLVVVNNVLVSTESVESAPVDAPFDSAMDISPGAQTETRINDDPFAELSSSQVDEVLVASPQVEVESEPISILTPSDSVKVDDDDDAFDDVFVSSPPPVVAVASVDEVAVSESIIDTVALPVESNVETTTVSTTDDFGGADDDEWDDFEGPSTAAVTPCVATVDSEPSVSEAKVVPVVEVSPAVTTVSDDKPKDEFQFDDSSAAGGDDDEWDAFEEAPSVVAVTPTVTSASATVAPVVVGATIAPPAVVDSGGDDDDWDAFEEAPSASTSTAVPVAVSNVSIPAPVSQPVAAAVIPEKKFEPVNLSAATNKSSPLVNFFPPSIQVSVTSGIVLSNKNVTDEVSAVKELLNSATFTSQHLLGYQAIRALSTDLFTNPVLTGSATMPVASIAVNMEALNALCVDNKNASASNSSDVDWTSTMTHTALVNNLPVDAVPVEQLRRVQLKRIMATNEYRNRAYAQAVKSSIKKTRSAPPAQNSRRGSHNVTLDGTTATATPVVEAKKQPAPVSISGKSGASAVSTNRSMTSSPVKPPAKADSLMSLDNAFHDDDIPSSSSSVVNNNTMSRNSFPSSSAHGSFDNDDEDDFEGAEFASAENSPKNATAASSVTSKPTAAPTTPTKSSFSLFGSSKESKPAVAVVAPSVSTGNKDNSKPPMIPKDSKSNTSSNNNNNNSSSHGSSGSVGNDKYVIEKDQYSSGAYNFLVSLPDLSYILNPSPVVGK